MEGPIESAEVPQTGRELRPARQVLSKPRLLHSALPILARKVVLLREPAPDEVLWACGRGHGRDGCVQVGGLVAALPRRREYRVAQFRFAGPGREPFPSN